MTTEKFAKADTNQEKREREARVKIGAEIGIERGVERERIGQSKAEAEAEAEAEAGTGTEINQQIPTTPRVMRRRRRVDIMIPDIAAVAAIVVSVARAMKAMTVAMQVLKIGGSLPSIRMHFNNQNHQYSTS